MTVSEIIQLLESPHFTDRARGADALKDITLIEDFRTIARMIEERDSDLLRLELLRFIDILLSLEDPRFAGEALRMALGFSALPRKTLRREAEKILDVFFGTARVNQHLKLLTIRSAWIGAGEPEREIATRKIGTYQLTDALPLLLDNFESKKREFVLVTIEVFRKLGDQRGNGELRKILRTSDDPTLLRKALEALSELGNFFDRKLFYKHLETRDPELQLTSLEGVSFLLKDRSIPLLRSFFDRLPDIGKRRRIVSMASRIPSPKVVRFLIDLLETSPGTEVASSIEWAINETSAPLKRDTLLKAYEKASEPVRFRIIVLLTEIRSPKVFDFYLDVIRKNVNPFLTMAAMEGASHYDDARTLDVLRPHLRDPEALLHYYALASFLRHSGAPITEAIELAVEFHLPEERHHHQLLLNVLSEQRELTGLSLFLQTYVLRMLDSSVPENRYLSYVVVGRYPLDFELGGVFERLVREKDSIVKKDALRIMARIATQNAVTFFKASPPLEILYEKDFRDNLSPDARLLVALLEGKHWNLVTLIQERSPVEFRRILFEYLRHFSLEDEVFPHLDLVALTDEEFLELWELFGKRPEVRYHLIREGSRRRDEAFGDVLLQEYLSHRDPGIAPFVSRFINGIP